MYCRNSVFFKKRNGGYLYTFERERKAKLRNDERQENCARKMIERKNQKIEYKEKSEIERKGKFRN